MVVTARLSAWYHQPKAGFREGGRYKLMSIICMEPENTVVNKGTLGRIPAAAKTDVPQPMWHYCGCFLYINTLNLKGSPLRLLQLLFTFYNEGIEAQRD